MKKAFYLFILLTPFLIACGNEQKKEVVTQRTKSIDEFIRIPTENGNIDESEMARITFENDFYNFDTIVQGEKVEHVFQFRNNGKKALKIADVTSTCGCTVPHYTEDVIQVGEEGEIRVVFDSEGKSGLQDKKISIFANTYPNETILSVVGFVKEKKD